MQNNQDPKEKIGDSGYVNNNCWMVRNLGYSPYKRCQYCESSFHNCLFLHYQLISVALIVLFFVLFFMLEGRVSQAAAISIFSLVIIYGYFFNKSTDRIIEANFVQRKAKEDLQELSNKLEQKVNEQTKEIKEAYKKIEKAYIMEKRAHEELKRLSEVKSQFLLSTQHHLRSPLSVIKGYLSMVAEGSYGRIPFKVKEKIGATLDATQKLIQLVNDLLDVAHFQMHKGVATKQPTDVSVLVGQIVADLKNSAQAKKIYLKLDAPAGTIPMIAVDPQGIREAIYNLVDNAIKYTQNGGVTVSIAAIGKKMRLQVIDTGIGMSEEDLHGIFKRTFERGEKAKVVNANGKGIGLYLAAQMISSNGGTIRARSDGWGKGTKFTVDFPQITPQEIVAANIAAVNENQTTPKIQPD